MAAINYKRTTVDKVTLKGYLDSESKTLTYTEKVDGVELEDSVLIQDYLDQFADNMVDITIQVKKEEMLDLNESNTICEEEL